MGYTTTFAGEFRLDRPLDDETYEELSAMDGPFDECDGYPSRWCQWTVGDDWQSIRWNGGEKFYGYIGWIRLFNGRFLAPRGYRLGGTVRFQGEDPGDSGKIVAADGRIEVRLVAFTDVNNGGDDVAALLGVTGYHHATPAATVWPAQAGELSRRGGSGRIARMTMPAADSSYRRAVRERSERAADDRVGAADRMPGRRERLRARRPRGLHAAPGR